MNCSSKNRIQLGDIDTFCPPGAYFDLGVMKNFAFLWHILILVYWNIWISKIRQEKLLQFTKILNYVKSSCIIYMPNIYIGTNVLKNMTRKKIWTTSSLCLAKCFNTSIMFTLKALLSKNLLFLFSHLLPCKNSTIF